MRRWIGLLVVPLGLACATAPGKIHEDIGVTIPDRWTAVATDPGAVEGEWWIAFGDPVLDTLVAEAFDHNFNLMAASARVDAAAAQARIAGADLSPQVSVGLSGRRERRNFIGLPIPGAPSQGLSTTFTSLGVSLDTTWEVDLWGRIRAGKAAALADLQAVRAEHAAIRLSLAGQIAKAWFALTESRQQVELARDTVASHQSTADRVRSRFELGLRPSLDLRLALSNLFAAEALLDQRLGLFDRTVRQLEILLGRYPNADQESSADLPAVPDPVPAGLPSELVTRRPDLVAAERRLAAADARLAEARRSLYPRLILTASGGTSSNELKDLLDGDFRVWSLIANLLQPVFQGGRLRAGVDAAEARSREVLSVFAEEVLRAFAEVESALAAEGFLAGREEDLREAAAQADAARRLAQDRYDAGLEDLVTVLDSQRRYLTARSLFLAVRRLRLDARVNLHLALGGGFAGERS